MPSVAFLTDAPDTLTLASGTATSRVQIAKTGNFEDPRYGKFAITTKDFDKWEANFASLSKADDRAGLPVDLDHSPEKLGNTEAVGWVTKLDRPVPNELWATVEWNTLGQELVKDRRYRYLSPSYQHDFADETGRKHGTALVGVALTNRPFLTMATISLSRGDTFAVEVEPDADSLPQMPTLIESIRTALSLSDDADEATVLSTVTEVAKRPVTDPNATPGDVSLSALAQKQGMVVLSAADHLKLAADAAAGATAAKELRQSKFEIAFKDAVKNGQVLPAMESAFQLSYNADPDATVKTLSELPKSVNMNGNGYTGDLSKDKPNIDAKTLAAANAENWDVDDERAALDSRASELASEHKIDYMAALDMAMQES